MKEKFKSREALPSEYHEIGELMVTVYSQLEGFPTKTEQPQYYEMLENIGEWCNKPHTKLFVAVNEKDEIGGAVVYFSDMKYYGSGGTATSEKNAGGFRLLAVHPKFRGKGLGKKLSLFCIYRTKLSALDKVVIHSTKYMKVAWSMYEKMGFERAPDLDFMQDELPVYGFRFIFEK